MISLKAIAAPLAAACALALAGAAQAGELRLINASDMSLTVTVDTTAPTAMGAGTLTQVVLAPGVHELQFEAADGSGYRDKLTFEEADAAQIKGGQYWCLLVTRPTDSAVGKAPVKALRPSKEWCKGFVEKDG